MVFHTLLFICNTTNLDDIFFFWVLEIESRAVYMVGKPFIIELHTQPTGEICLISNLVYLSLFSLLQMIFHAITRPIFYRESMSATF
jgi:hypothetical protein